MLIAGGLLGARAQVPSRGRDSRAEPGGSLVDDDAPISPICLFSCPDTDAAIKNCVQARGAWSCLHLTCADLPARDPAIQVPAKDA